MEQRDLTLIQELVPDNQLLGKLIDQHQIYENELFTLDEKPYLTPMDSLQRKKLQKLKLLGRDEIDRILTRTRLDMKVQQSAHAS